MENIICPHCNYKYSECLDYFEKDYSDEDNISIQCENCNKEFIVSLHINYSFECFKKEEEKWLEYQ